ncbi:hypothetical protein MMC10_004016 [Thelotrema lepadinum]|nr:hypothetical protein [Thelotrema lepadinum]
MRIQPLVELLLAYLATSALGLIGLFGLHDPLWNRKIENWPPAPDASDEEREKIKEMNEILRKEKGIQQNVFMFLHMMFMIAVFCGKNRTIDECALTSEIHS